MISKSLVFEFNLKNVFRADLGIPEAGTDPCFIVVSAAATVTPVIWLGAVPRSLADFRGGKLADYHITDSAAFVQGVMCS
jgi:hypothetical protein